jgi:transcriptional antiterminator NusG
MKKWYIIHTQTGSEEKVKKGLEQRIKTAGMAEEIEKILIPTEQISEIRSGKKRVSHRKFFPGYLLVYMELNEKTWFLVKSTAGITSFIGMGKKPSALTDKEVETILVRSRDSEVKPSPKVVFEIGESVRIIDGPFVNFNGTIDEIQPDKGKLKASVSIFGRATPVELEYWQVEKI